MVDRALLTAGTLPQTLSFIGLCCTKLILNVEIPAANARAVPGAVGDGPRDLMETVGKNRRVDAEISNGAVRIRVTRKQTLNVRAEIVVNRMTCRLIVNVNGDGQPISGYARRWGREGPSEINISSARGGRSRSGRG